MVGDELNDAAIEAILKPWAEAYGFAYSISAAKSAQHGVPVHDIGMTAECLDSAFWAWIEYGQIAVDYIHGLTGITRTYNCSLGELPALLDRIRQSAQDDTHFARSGGMS